MSWNNNRFGIEMYSANRSMKNKLPPNRNKSNNKQYFEEEKRELWKNIVVSIVTANDCKTSNIAINWADTIIKEFESRFNKEK